MAARAYSGKKPKNLKHTLRVFLSYLGRHKKMLAVVAVLVTISAGANLLGTYMIRPVVNGLADGDVHTLLCGVLITALIFGCGALAAYGYTQTMVKAAQQVVFDIRRDLFEHVQTLPLQFFDSRRHGDIMSLFTNDSDTMADALNNSFAMVIQSFIQIVGTLTLLYILNWRLSLIVTVCYGIMFWYIKFSGKRSKGYYTKQQNSLGELNGYIEELITGQKVVKVFHHEEESFTEFCKKNEELRKAGTGAQGYAATMVPVDRLILKDISLYAKPGQKIAFVGSTGAGKTTITNLINRFYDVQGGAVVYDGIDVKDIEKDALRHSLGIVLQDTHLFTGTVAENIRFGKLDATQEEIERAAKIANADSFIRRLPNGYDTMLTSDGANLSQGQRQLLAIARAAVADPPVLILDEATSSVDTRTEALIEKGMDQLMEGRTVFVIAHRLSTVRNANAIMVLEQGNIVERGDHDALLAQKGKYYQLYHGMFELS